MISVIATWTMIASMVYLILHIRNAARDLHKSVRREERIWNLVVAQQEWFIANRELVLRDSPELARIQSAHLALLDELTAQDYVRTWQRIPRLGEPWPESMPRHTVMDDVP